MLYTRKGDGGTTKTLRQEKGVRISKASCSTEALGAMDELNSFLGLVKVKAAERGFIAAGEKGDALILEVQGNLFIIQAELAGADKTIKPEKIARIESLVDAIEKDLPPIKSFFISGGTELAALLDISRTLARTAERRAIQAIESGEVSLGEHTRSYLNRLSSLLYAMARFANHSSGVKEPSPTYE